MRRMTLLILWLASDYALFLLTCAVAYFVKVGWIFSTDVPFNQYMPAVAIGGFAWLGSLLVTRCFALTRKQASVRSSVYILYATLFGVAIVTLAYFFLYQDIFSRAIIVIAIILNAAVTWIWHVLFDILQRSALRSSPPAFPTLIVGVTREARQLIKLMQERKSPLKPVGILDAAGVKDSHIENVPVLGKLNKLEEALTSLRISHLIQCSDLEQSMNLLSACRAHGITYMLLPSVLGIVERDERVETLEGKAVTVVSPEGGWWGWFFR